MHIQLIYSFAYLLRSCSAEQCECRIQADPKKCEQGHVLTILCCWCSQPRCSKSKMWLPQVPAIPLWTPTRPTGISLCPRETGTPCDCYRATTRQSTNLELTSLTGQKRGGEWDVLKLFCGQESHYKIGWDWICEMESTKKKKGNFYSIIQKWITTHVPYYYHAVYKYYITPPLIMCNILNVMSYNCTSFIWFDSLLDMMFQTFAGGHCLKLDLFEM